MPVEPNQFDDAALAEIRRNQEDPIVVYVIIRKSLNMGVGKIAAQVHHVAKILMLAFARLVNLYECCDWGSGQRVDQLNDKQRALHTITNKWIKSSFRTIILVANDKQWEKLKEEVNVFVVRDAGLTEVEPGSETVMSTWPMYKSQAPKIIQKLQTLK